VVRLPTSFSFNANLKAYFQADEGGFSIVTANEFSKKQITFVGPEQAITEAFFGTHLSYRHGNREDIIATGHDPDLLFRYFPSGEIVPLTVSYKTNRPNELRMYLRSASFKPRAGEYWGVFRRGMEIWLCNFSATWLEQLQNDPALFQERQALEPEVDDFQDVLNENRPDQIESRTMKWKRNPKVAAEALKRSNYKCEIFPSMVSFLARRTNKPYMEAHHLVPMGLQGSYEANLDCLQNICILNPYAHRLLHHAASDVVLPEVLKLVSTRKAFIKEIGLVEDDVIGIYCQP
jgi:5-methylcytosine-specific restriction enzyme A